MQSLYPKLHTLQELSNNTCSHVIASCQYNKTSQWKNDQMQVLKKKLKNSEI